MNGENLISAFRRVSLRFKSRIKATGEADDVEDALQDAFCRLWSRRADITGERQAEGLLVTASRNLRIDNVRRRQAHPESSIEDLGDIGFLQQEEDGVSDLYRKIDKLASENLSQRDREILYHREKDGWEFEDLAQFYGLSEGNVRLIVSRARKNLRNLYLNNQSNG